MEIKNNIQGTHDGQEFIYEDGLLTVFGVTWDRKRIKTLVEIANLLDHQGYPIKSKKAVTRIVYTGFGMPYMKTDFEEEPNHD